MPQVFMQGDDGKLSAGHVYTVSQKTFDRLTNTSVQIRVLIKGRGESIQRRKLAIPATADHLNPPKIERPKDGREPIKMTHDVGKFGAGRIYWFGPDEASRYCDGYEQQGRRFQPCAIRVDPDTIVHKPKVFLAERVPGISPKKAKELADQGFGDPDAIIEAKPAALRKAGLSAKLVEALKAEAANF